jgi:predicted ester cyclase
LSSESHEAKTRRLYQQVWNERRLELIDEWVTPDFVGHWSMYPEPVRGPAGFRAVAEELLRAMPDAHFEVMDTVAADDKVASRIRTTGTHTGALQGFAPTGARLEMEYLALERYDGERVAEEWVRSDDLGVSRQIGALPPAGSRAERMMQRLFALKAARMRRR